MVCWVSARLGQGIPAMRQEARRAAGNRAVARRTESGCTRLRSSRAVAISAPRTRLVRARRRPTIQHPKVQSAMPPTPHPAPVHAQERIVWSMRLRIRSILRSATMSMIG